jgi:methylenetetrahydrofolate reductase (NADPH)
MENETVNKFKDSICNPDSFTVTWEQIPGRINTRAQLNSILTNAEEAAAGNVVECHQYYRFSQGAPALPSEVVALEVKKLGIEPWFILL